MDIEYEDLPNLSYWSYADFNKGLYTAHHP